MKYELNDFIHRKGWKELTLGQLCEEGGGSIQTGPFGSQLHAADYVEKGIPSIMPKNIHVDGINDNDIARITKIDAERLSKYLVEKGDIVYSRRGDVEKCSLITDKEIGWLCGTGCLRVRLGRKSKVSPVFIHAYLSLPITREWIVRHAIGATMPNLNTEILSNVPILIPSEKERKYIEDIWQNIIDRILINRQINQTLEQIAQAIFKSWFVDFEPVKAKMAAKQAGATPEQIERAAMCAISGKTEDQLAQLPPATQQHLKTTAALFPDALVDSELGAIPMGYYIGSIGNIAKAIGGYAFKGESFVNEGNPVVKIKNITGNGQVDIIGSQCITDELTSSSERFQLFDGNLVMAMTGATVCKVGIVVSSGKKVYLNQRVAKFESKKFGPKISWFLYCCFQRDSIFDLLVGAAYGSAQPNISTSGIESTKLILPNYELIECFCSSVDNMFKKWISSINENTMLVEFRDSLLPKFLSGEIDVNNVA